MRKYICNMIKTNHTFVAKSANASNLNADSKPNVLDYYSNASIISESYFQKKLKQNCSVLHTWGNNSNKV